MMLLCADTKYYSILVVISLGSTISPDWYFLYLVLSFSYWRTLCWCWIRGFVCSVDFYDVDIVDAPLVESVDITGAFPGSVGATHVWLLLKIS